MVKLSDMVKELTSGHKRKKMKNCEANIIAEECKKLIGKRKPTILEMRIAELTEKKDNFGQAIHPKIGCNYQISFQALSARLPDLAHKAGHIDICQVIYINDVKNEVVCQWPNLHVETLLFTDLITVV